MAQWQNILFVIKYAYTNLMTNKIPMKTDIKSNIISLPKLGRVY